MKFSKLIQIVISRFIASNHAKRYIASNRAMFQRSNNQSDRHVLINQVHSYPLIELYAHVSNFLAKKEKATVYHYRFESERLDRLGLPHLVLESLFRSFGSRLALTWQWWRLDSLELILKALFTYKGLQSKNDLLELKIEGIPVGTLIYDTYLRRYRQETVSIKSWHLIWILIQAQFIARRIHQYLNNNHVVSVFPGDVSYIYSGIVARAAILRNIPTYSVVEIPLRLQLMGLNFYRRVPYWRYRETFSTLPKTFQRRAKKEAAVLIDARLNGHKDERMAYINQSAFAANNKTKRVLLGTKKTKVLVLLHDFFDSPHIYPRMLFADFWEWICFTLERASNTSYEWYVKPHPNGLPGNGRILAQLKTRFPKVHFLDPKTSNRQIVDEGIAAVFTVYGSAGHEFPYLGVPTVMAGENPHVAYDFTLNPRNLGEYSSLIEKAGDLYCKADRGQLCEFYYMHYCHYKSMLPLDPVYPPKDFCLRMGITDLTSKEQRNCYHKADTTLAYLLENRTGEQQQKLRKYFWEVFN